MKLVKECMSEMLNKYKQKNYQGDIRKLKTLFLGIENFQRAKTINLITKKKVTQYEGRPLKLAN